MDYQRLLVRPQYRINGSAALVADQSAAIGIMYKGTQPSATFTNVSATGITLKQGVAGSEVADVTVGASANGVVDFATDTTIGAVVDRINQSPNWRAEVVDALRIDSVASSATLARSETTFAPVRTQVLPLFWDTSVFLSSSYLISARRLNFLKKRGGFQAVVRDIKAFETVGSGTLTLFIYDVNPKTGVSTLMAQFAGTSGTELNPTIGANTEYRSEFGHDLLIRYSGSAVFLDTGMYLRINGFCE